MNFYLNFSNGAADISNVANFPLVDAAADLLPSFEAHCSASFDLTAYIHVQVKRCFPVATLCDDKNELMNYILGEGDFLEQFLEQFALSITDYPDLRDEQIAAFDEAQQLVQIEMRFDAEYEGTYVVDVVFGKDTYSVNCQRASNHSYVLLNSLSATNESGGDYADSGLRYAINTVFKKYDCDSEQYEKALITKIEACAEAHLPDNSIEAYIAENYDCQVKQNSEDRVFGACYANNSSFSRYDEIDGDRIILVAQNDNEFVNSLIAEATIVFANLGEYQAWYDRMKDESGRHYGDCGLAYYAYNSVVADQY